MTGKFTGRRRSGVVFVAVLMFGLLLAPAAVWAQEPEPVTLRYFTWAGGAAAQHIREDFIEPFQELYPHITIEYEAVSFGEFFDKLLTYYASGNAPDLMHMSVGYVYDYADMGILLNLQPLFDRDLNEDDFFMEPFKAMRYPSMEGGDLYGIPFAFVMSSFYYNQSMFDQMGLAYPDDTWTWETISEVGKRLTRDTDGDGVIDKWGFYSTYDYKLLEMVIRAFGGRVLDEDFNVVVDQPAAVQATQLLVDMIHVDGIAPPVTADGNRLFREGNLAMHVTNISDLTSFREVATFDWNVALMPAGPAGRVVRLWPDSFAISSTSQHVEEAWEYIKFVITQTKMDRYSGARKVPVYKALATSPEWLEQDQLPDKMVFIQQVAYGDPLEFRPNWGEWNDARVGALRPAWMGQEPVLTGLQRWAQAIRNAISRD
ncbi:MAG: sugar ABC transporter substrate-binding protein [Firmicutes bacterium]|nr:sugar ABC transporter substrate-binding protein [Bacillota bacterium]